MSCADHAELGREGVGGHCIFFRGLIDRKSNSDGRGTVPKPRSEDLLT